jgi:acyl-coenzyme A thioesterase PaaI-like protein
MPPSPCTGSVYFKMLDDAAFFAVNSIVEDVFVYTVSLNVQLLRPVASGTHPFSGHLEVQVHQPLHRGFGIVRREQ